jgi:kinesin family protein 5
MAGELSDLRLQLERIVYESKETAITTDAMREQNVDLASELEELRVRFASSSLRGLFGRWKADLLVRWIQKSMNELKVTQKSVTQEGKDKKKAEKMAAMMAGLDTVSSPLSPSSLRPANFSPSDCDWQGGMSEKEAEIRASLARLDDAVNADRPLSQEDISMLRRQLEDSQVLVREQQDKSKQVQEENEILTRRKDELESRLAGLETEYEELLGASSCHLPFLRSERLGAEWLTSRLVDADKTIQEDERADTDLSANVQDIKVRSRRPPRVVPTLLAHSLVSHCHIEQTRDPVRDEARGRSERRERPQAAA